MILGKRYDIYFEIDIHVKLLAGLCRLTSMKTCILLQNSGLNNNSYQHDRYV